MYKTGRLNLTSNTAATPEARLQFCSQSNWSLSLEWSHICLLLHRALTKRLENLSTFRNQSSVLIDSDIEAFLKFSQSGQTEETGSRQLVSLVMQIPWTVVSVIYNVITTGQSNYFQSVLYCRDQCIHYTEQWNINLVWNSHYISSLTGVYSPRSGVRMTHQVIVSSFKNQISMVKLENWFSFDECLLIYYSPT